MATLSGGLSNTRYKAGWFNPRTGEWIDARIIITDASGQIALPNFPGNLARSNTDWGLKLKSVDTR
ncbi:MAG: hypothetical protein ACYSWZ_15995 [Planctomycetota bacterium]